MPEGPARDSILAVMQAGIITTTRRGTIVSTPIDCKKIRNIMNINKITLSCSLVASLLASACGTTSGPTKLDAERWKIVDKNYLEAAKEANAHCKSLGQNTLKVISRKAGEDSVEVIYQCAKE